MSDNLKPCPFCGEKHVMHEQGHVIITETARSGPRFGVRCYSCGGRIEFFDTVAEAVAAWNSRADRTCRDLGGCDEAGMQVFNCSECRCVLSLFDVSGLNTLCTSHVYDYPRFCPNCGAKVVSE